MECPYLQRYAVVYTPPKEDVPIDITNNPYDRFKEVLQLGLTVEEIEKHLPWATALSETGDVEEIARAAVHAASYIKTYNPSTRKEKPTTS